VLDFQMSAAASPHQLIQELHGLLLRTLAVKLGKHLQGLGHAGRFMRNQGMISANSAKKLVMLDHSYNLVRHITKVSANQFFDGILEELSDTGHLPGSGNKGVPVVDVTDDLSVHSSECEVDGKDDGFGEGLDNSLADSSGGFDDVSSNLHLPAEVTGSGAVAHRIKELEARLVSTSPQEKLGIEPTVHDAHGVEHDIQRGMNLASDSFVQGGVQQQFEKLGKAPTCCSTTQTCASSCNMIMLENFVDFQAWLLSACKEPDVANLVSIVASQMQTAPAQVHSAVPPETFIGSGSQPPGGLSTQLEDDEVCDVVEKFCFQLCGECSVLGIDPSVSAVHENGGAALLPLADGVGDSYHFDTQVPLNNAGEISRSPSSSVAVIACPVLGIDPIVSAAHENGGEISRSPSSSAAVVALPVGSAVGKAASETGEDSENSSGVVVHQVHGAVPLQKSSAAVVACPVLGIDPIVSAAHENGGENSRSPFSSAAVVALPVGSAVGKAASETVEDSEKSSGVVLHQVQRDCMHPAAPRDDEQLGGIDCDCLHPAAPRDDEHWVGSDSDCMHSAASRDDEQLIDIDASNQVGRVSFNVGKRPRSTLCDGRSPTVPPLGNQGPSILIGSVLAAVADPKMDCGRGVLGIDPSGDMGGDKQFQDDDGVVCGRSQVISDLLGHGPPLCSPPPVPAEVASRESHWGEDDSDEAWSCDESLVDEEGSPFPALPSVDCPWVIQFLDGVAAAQNVLQFDVAVAAIGVNREPGSFTTSERERIHQAVMAYLAATATAEIGLMFRDEFCM